MTTKSPRVYVTLNESDLECIRILAEKRKLTASNIIRNMVQDWLEHYEDEQLSLRAIEAEKEWEKGGRKTYTHEEICKIFDIQ